MDELYLGIAGVDDPYPKHVQDALDFIEKETRRQEKFTEYHERRKLSRAEPPARNDKDLVFRTTRRKQQAAQQKKRPYQPIYSADEVSLFPGIIER